MTRKLCLCLTAICLVLGAAAQAAAQYPIVVFPDPISFGTIPLNTPGFPVEVFVTNISSSSAAVSLMAIGGTNSSDFAFDGPNCVGTISAGQTCQMYMTFTPSAMGNRAGVLVIGVSGQTQRLRIPLQGVGGNPIPTITSLSPPAVYLNSPAVTVTVNGSSFMSGSVVSFSNTQLPTTFVSSTQLTAQVPASFFTFTNYYFVNVVNPPPGGGSSTSLNFQVIAPDPSVNNISPVSVIAGTSPSAITLNGGNFMNGATVLWNGRAVPTTYVNSSQVQFLPTTAQLATPGIAQLSVRNPSPGGVSSEMNFDVTYPVNVNILNLPANDIVWDPVAKRIYASLPSSFGTNGNSIAVVNPYTGNVSAYHFVGSEPAKLALSADSAYLYVGLNGNGSVQRVLLPTFALDINVSLGSSQFGGLNIANDLKVFPGDSHTFAVALGTVNCCGGGPLEFFTDTTQLANSVTFPTIGDLAFGDASTLYGYSSGTVSQIAVNSSGGTLTQQWNGLVNGDDIVYDSGLIYGTAGQVLNPATGLLVGTYDVSAGCCGSSAQLLTDSAINRVYAVGTTPFFNGFGITSYNLSKFTPIAVANLSELNGSAQPSFIHWGNNGLAFILQSGCCGSATAQVVVVQSPKLVPTAPKPSAPSN